jgi:class 3 adenylate cyclase
MPGLEVRIDDLRAVMDAVGSQRAAVLGTSEGGSMCALFAATHPDRVSALVLHAAFARQLWAEDIPWGRNEEQQEARLDGILKGWDGAIDLELRIPSMAHDEHFRERWARRMRHSASGADAVALIRVNAETDIRSILPTIRVPTLLLHSVNEKTVDIRHSRYLASKIPGAKLVEMNGPDHFPIGTDADLILDEIEGFLTGVRQGPKADRVLATVLFTDIVGATAMAARLGDRRWRDLLAIHQTAVRRELARHRGREIDTAGDGFLAAFDGPARAVRCACSICDEAKAFGIEVRAGVHTGECEEIGDKLGGISVHIGARVAAFANPGEVLVSSTVKDLVAGSGLRFADQGVRELKGVPGEWRLFAVER